MKQVLAMAPSPRVLQAMNLLRQQVEDHPGAITAWDVNTRKRMFVLRSMARDTLISTDVNGVRGICGLQPLVTWVLNGQARLALGKQELKLERS